MKALLDTMEQEKPEYVAIAFDPAEPTFRHEADVTYKEGRPDVPEDFLPDLLNLRELLLSLNLAIFSVPGYEADDVIGTLCRKAMSEGYRVKVLTGDRDMFQLIDPEERTSILYLSTTFGKSTPPPREFKTDQVKDKMGILPTQVVDYKALCGDASDNIPGVKGIGDKTAVTLLNTYGNLLNIYDHLDDIKGAVRQKLEAGKDSALHSQYLAQIHMDVPVVINLEACKLREFDDETVVPLLEKLEFRSFLNRLQKLHGQFGGEPNSTTGASTEHAAPAPAPRIYESEDLWFFSPEDTATFQQYTQAAIAPQIIDTPAKLTELIATLEACTHPVAWDTETTSLEPRDADLVGIGCCWGDGASDVAYIPTGHTQGNNLDKATVLNALRPILESAAYPKALQNAKFDRLVLRCQGVDMAGVVFDTMLASYVLNPEATHNLAELGRKYLNINAQSYDQLVAKGKTIADLDISSVAVYCGTDAYTVFCLLPIFQSELAQVPKLNTLLLDVEQPLEPVLAEMEFTGVRIDQAYLKEFSRTLEIDLRSLEARAHEAAGEPFNLASPKQLSELLFEKLKLDKRKSKKRATGYSTDAATLEKLQGDHPVVDFVQQHRTLSKLKSTYVDALPALVRPDTQRVHTDFNQTITATGRLSSSNPNLQNIPIRTEFSRQIRKGFIPQDGWLLVAADYSQIELRILAHLSGEPILIDTYRQGGDVHTVTAKLLFEKDVVTSDERRLAKTINFGVIYGMGAQRFARESGYSTAQAKTFIERFNDRYSQVFGYLQQMQREAIAQGYVETILGRRRYFNFASENLKALRGNDPGSIDLDKIRLRDQYDAQLLRAAANAPIQGSSSDIIKIAMIHLHELLKGHRANLLLQVHDELVFEIDPNEWQVLQPQIKSLMESAVALTVPLVAEIHAGQNWMEAK